LDENAGIRTRRDGCCRQRRGHDLHLVSLEGVMRALFRGQLTTVERREVTGRCREGIRLKSPPPAAMGLKDA
jgi:hypothetical protein